MTKETITLQDAIEAMKPDYLAHIDGIITYAEFHRRVAQIAHKYDMIAGDLCVAIEDDYELYMDEKALCAFENEFC